MKSTILGLVIGLSVSTLLIIACKPRNTVTTPKPYTFTVVIPHRHNLYPIGYKIDKVSGVAELTFPDGHKAFVAGNYIIEAPLP